MSFEPGPLWAFINFEDVSNGIINGNKIFLAIRIVAAVIGGVVGWFLCGPILCGLYRLMVRKAIPGLLLFPLRLSGAVAIGAAVFLFLPLGKGGWGWGPGGGPGEGPGKGEGKGPGDGPGKGPGSESPSPGKTGSSKGDVQANDGKEKIDIRVLGGDEYKKAGKYVHGKDKYYLVKIGTGQSAAKTISEVESLFEEHKNNISVVIHPGDAVDVDVERLLNSVKSRKIHYIETE